MRFKLFLFSGFFLFILLSCFKETSTEGWEYNNPQNGGFQRVPYFEQETAPDMVLVEGRIHPVSKYSYADTLNSFYISKYEETNGQYLAYVQYIKKYYSDATYKSVLPDTTVWLNIDFTQEEKDDLIKNYFRDPLYKNFPVVGVSPAQIERYAWWKTDRINEFILIREGIFTYPYWMLDSTDVFTTNEYLSDAYHPHDDEEPRLIDLDPKGDWSGKRSDLGQRIIRLVDGIFLPRYRLCNIDEWQMAALAMGDHNHTYIKTQKEMDIRRYDKERYFDFLKIYFEKKTEQNLSFAAQKIKRVYEHQPNNYLIYGMAQGASEIVQLDSSDFYFVGGSWKLKMDYSAVYFKEKERAGYKFPFEFKEPISIDQDSSRAVGFRLAMDRLGDPIGASRSYYTPKRRKAN